MYAKPMTTARKSLYVCLIAGATVASQGAEYRVAVDPDAGAARVEISLARGESSDLFSMPAWAPGDYRIVNFGRHVRDVKFWQGADEIPLKDGRANGVNAWRASRPGDKVTYTVLAQPAGIFSENLRITATEVFWNGPAVFGWLEGHAKEAHSVRVETAPVGGVFVCPLSGVLDAKSSERTFTARDYDTLVDSPVVFGTTVSTRTFTVSGKEHVLAAFRRPASLSLMDFETTCRAIVTEAQSLIGELPYARYVFFLDVGGPGGGLEHADSARLAIPPGIRSTGVAGFLAHEFFHAFNVKRIRPKPLGPFDYTKPAITSTLWWMEGVTDYYAELLTYRAGLVDQEEFLANLGYAVDYAMNSPAAETVSAADSSRRVWEANNSSGFGGLSYYDKGKAIGFCLDLAIRWKTGGVRSLDDVVRTLYAETSRGKPGFGDGRIRDVCVQVGGSELAAMYDACVERPGPLPIRDALAAHGLFFDGRGIQRSPNASADALRLLSQFLTR